ncbi:hypothetical protein Bbelb_311780 [Branchiostoma belcheri]|nr:hypothetical protein Bbelb_311780 [Branchiostoma belcheri]
MTPFNLTLNSDNFGQLLPAPGLLSKVRSNFGQLLQPPGLLSKVRSNFGQLLPPLGRLSKVRSNFRQFLPPPGRLSKVRSNFGQLLPPPGRLSEKPDPEQKHQLPALPTTGRRVLLNRCQIRRQAVWTQWDTNAYFVPMATRRDGCHNNMTDFGRYVRCTEGGAAPRLSDNEGPPRTDLCLTGLVPTVWDLLGPAGTTSD